MNKAILALDRVKAKLEAVERQKSEPIAVIGMACRFPGGGDTPEAFFRFLKEGGDAVTQVPADRWRLDATEDTASTPEGRAIRWGAFLREPLDRFDARFFGISPREAAHLDPQQRLVLELAWEALERAGLDPARLVGSSSGVFLGISTNDYLDLCKAAGPEGEDVYAATGNGHAFAAGRLSYVLGFQGPSLTVDTVCSSSLVALHLACQSLRAGEATLGLAGGVNLMLSPDTTWLTATTQGLSPDGRCKTFDAAANGFVRSEGCGMVVLKLLSDAQRDGDPILALIRGSAVNQDGRSTGLTTPNVLSQQAMLRQALASARVAPEEIGYVEAHGTGTSLGDPIEFEALRAVVGQPRADGATCVLGAVKSNIGHLEAAAGIAGLIKVVMAFQEEMIPGNLHFRALNPRMSLEGTPFVIPTENRPWPRGYGARLAGVSSFGMSGTNAHVVLEEPPAPEPAEAPPQEVTSTLMPISAKSPEALRALAQTYARVLAEADGARLADLAYTASVRRTHHECRLAITGRTREEIARSLADLARDGLASNVVQGRAPTTGRPRVVYVFSGQGSQWLGMGRQLLAEEPVFRAKLEQCSELLRRYVSWTLLDELQAPEERSRLAETKVVQPALFAIQVALVKLLKSWGVPADAVIGHSVGEVAAAHVAGVLSLDEAARLVAWRGRIMQKASGFGKMAWVALPAEEAARAIAGRESVLAIAAINDPGSVVLSGETAALDDVVANLTQRGIQSRPLRVNYAFHSPQMTPLAKELEAALGRIKPKRGSIPLYSTVTGAAIDGERLDSSYWARNVREPVHFARAVAAAFGDGNRLFLEVGPHPVLSANLALCFAAEKEEGIAAFTLRRNADERRAMLHALGTLYTRGIDPNWKAVQQAEVRYAPLPTYPWQRERYWVELHPNRLHAGPVSHAEHRVAPPEPSRAAESSQYAVHPSVVAAPSPRRWQGKAAAEARAGLETLVRRTVAGVLGFANATALDADRGFAEMGLDSLMAVQLRNRLQAELGVTLSATLAFDHPTADRLVAHLLTGVLDLQDRAEAPAAASVTQDEPIAIVGAACRFPGGAEDLDRCWQLLAGGVVATTEVPASRWKAADWYDADPETPNRTYVTKGGFLREVETFDPGFFRISPREAASLDPQQRLLLEVSWEALESAGQVPSALRESPTGVFIGATYNEYIERLEGLSDDAAGPYALTGNMLSIAAGRVSFFLGLHGPSLAVDTACSSSLVALHLACQSLRQGECQQALVGGVNTLLLPSGFVMLSRMRALSPDGRCKTFSAAADGYGRAEGCAVVVLKRLSDAQRDGDRILTVIRGTAINHDGASSGLTVPNGPAQEAVIRQALANAGVAPAEVDFVECHGTGTALGDPIEVQSLGAVYGQDRPAERPLVLGSAKAIFGHMEPAAGLVGLLKVLLSLGHEQIPAQPEIGELNPLLSWDTLPVAVARTAVPWPRSDRPRRAGLSSFGLSGTNAHVVLEEPPKAPERPTAPERPAELVVLSGRSVAAVDAQAAQLRDHLEAHPEQGLGDVAFALATTRTSMEHRLAVTASSRDGLVAALEAAGQGQTPPSGARGTIASSRGTLAFLFTGQGAQVPGMGRGLYAIWPAFRAALDECVALFDRELDRPLREVMWCEPGSAEAAQLDQTAFTQPALFAIEYALAALWRSWGVQPDVVAGHSIGELVAACVAGVFSLEDAVRLVSARGRLMQALPAGGAMVSIATPEAAVADAVAAHASSVSIAAINGPEQVVIAGAEQSVQAISAAFAMRGVRVRALRVSHAFHSPLMQPMLEAFARVAESVTYERPSMPLVSNLSGKLVTDEVTAPAYWVRHVREAVRFADGVKGLHEAGAGTFLEVGPKATLLGLVPACLPDAKPALIASLRAGREEAASILDALGGLWSIGGAITWSGVFPTSGRRVSLPSYPWQRQRYWIEVPKQQAPTDVGTAADDALWSAVARGSDAVTALLELPEALHGSVDALLPHIAEWRQRRDEEHAVARRLYDESWPLAAPPSPLAGPHERPWLLVLPSPADWPSAEPIAKAIERALAEVGGRSERIEAASIADALPARLLAGAGGVITLTALDETSAPEHPHTPRGLAQTLEIAKLMPTASRPTPLWIVTRGAVAVRPDEPLPAPLQALHAGLGRVFALEHAEHWGGLIDLPLDVDGAIARLLVASLGDEEDQIALRAKGRHVRRLVRVTPGAKREPWQPTGTVLITGGTGALGAHLARRLAERGTPHVVLTSRRGPDAPGARALAEELEARGARVSLLACDLSDAAALDQLFARLDGAPEAEALSAVFHAAGLVEDAIVANLVPAQLDRVLQPKVAAAWAIHQRLASRRSAAPLVLFSSIAGFLGGMGQASYAAANAYLDALAQHRRALGLPTVSIQWGPWADGGMVTAEIDARARRLGLLALNPATALRSLELIVAEGRSRAVMDVDWTRFAPSFAADRARPLLLGVDEARAALEDRARRGSSPPGAEPALHVILADLADVERLQHLRSLVAAQTARVLGITSASSVDVERGFSDLGLDSLMAVELRRVLQAQTGLALPTTLAFDHPSIDAIAQNLLERLKATGELDRRRPIARPDWPELSALVERLLHAPLDELKATGVFDQMNALTRPVKRLDPTIPSGDASLDELARYVLDQTSMPGLAYGDDRESDG
jgi:acyl transferase domain-containing protein